MRTLIAFLFSVAAAFGQNVPTADGSRYYEYRPVINPTEIACPVPATLLPKAVPATQPTVQPATKPAPSTIPVVPEPTTSYPPNWIGVGAAYGPPVTGWASYARAVSTKQGVYSYTTYDVTLSKTHQLQTSTRTGFGLILRQVAVGGMVASLVALGDVGVVTGVATAPATGSAANVAYGGSGGVVVQLSKTSNWTAEVFVRRVQLSTGLQTIYEVGWGRTF